MHTPSQVASYPIITTHVTHTHTQELGRLISTMISISVVSFSVSLPICLVRSLSCCCTLLVIVYALLTLSTNRFATLCRSRNAIIFVSHWNTT